MTQKLLIIDDDLKLIELLSEYFEENGFQVHAIHEGTGAIKAVMEKGPDLIILDIMLPLIDGFEVCQAVRGDPDCKGIKIIFLTAMGRDMDVAKGLAYGADAYITKPFANAEVLETVRRLLG